MKPILLIVPHYKIAKMSKEVCSNCNDIDIKVGGFSEAINIAKNAKNDGVDVIVSRGGTATAIKETVPDIPIVEMQFSPVDMLTFLTKAKFYGKNIVVIGSENIISGIEKIGSLLDINLSMHYFKQLDIAENFLTEKMNRGDKVDVVFGGLAAEILAEKYGIPTIPLETSKSTINSSIKEARRIVHNLSKQKRQMKLVQNVVDYLDIEEHDTIDGLNYEKINENIEKLKIISKVNTLEDLKIHYINYVLKENNYNQTEAAKKLGISRTQLWRDIKKYNL